MELTCPKCHGPMRSYERNGVLIDQCTECRGIFLDRGELEKLVDAETAFHQAPATQSAAPNWGSREPARYEAPYRGDDRGYDPRYDGDHRYGKKRKKSFLENLFDD